MFSATRNPQSTRSMVTAFRLLSLHQERRIITLATTTNISNLVNNNNNYTNGHNNIRSFSSKRRNFTPRRRPDVNYRPIKPRGDKLKNKKGNKGKGFPQGNQFSKRSFGDELIELGDGTTPATGADPKFDGDELASELGPVAAEAIRHHWKEKELLKGKGSLSVEDKLRIMDYLTSPDGSTEDLAGERRALAFDSFSKEERERFLPELDVLIESERVKNLGLKPEEKEDDEEKEEFQNFQPLDMNDPDFTFDPNQQAYGEWYGT